MLSCLYTLSVGMILLESKINTIESGACVIIVAGNWLQSYVDQ